MNIPVRVYDDHPTPPPIETRAIAPFMQELNLFLRDLRETQEKDGVHPEAVAFLKDRLDRFRDEQRRYDRAAELSRIALDVAEKLVLQISEKTDGGVDPVVVRDGKEVEVRGPDGLSLDFPVLRFWS